MLTALVLVGLALASVSASAVASDPVSAASALHRCGRIDYESGLSESSAIKIRAVHIGCKRARRLVLGCIRGKLEPGWRDRSVPDKSVYGSHILMTSDRRRITFYAAGGGQCGYNTNPP
jgi:hypothetical protein